MDGDRAASNIFSAKVVRRRGAGDEGAVVYEVQPGDSFRILCSEGMCAAGVSLEARPFKSGVTTTSASGTQRFF